MLLVYYPDEGVIRAIGPECGERIENGEAYRQAKKNYDLERQRKQAEAYIETNLPRVPRTLYDLKRLERAAREATRLHTKFRSEAGTIIKALRRAGADGGGLLTVNAVLSNTNGEGPSGFGSGLRSAKEYFGPLRGVRFLGSRFGPISDWVTITKIADSLPFAKSSDDAFYWICDNEDLKTLLEAETKLRNLDQGFEQLIADIADVCEFFDPAFFDALARWGQHPDNDLSLIAEERGGVFSLSANSGKCVVKFKPDFAALNVIGSVGRTKH
jgi:hypothetical protein